MFRVYGFKYGGSNALMGSEINDLSMSKKCVFGEVYEQWNVKGFLF